MITDDNIVDAIFEESDDIFRELLPIPSNHILPSYEQQTAINHLLDGYNVVVDSVSGSGKSTTILSATQQMPASRILQITFNAMLRHEVSEKATQRELANLEVHTFHSLAVKYYCKNAHLDIVLRKIIRENITPRRTIPTFHFVFLDEAQDMTMLYFMFIVKFLKDMGKPFQLCVLGDYKQGIYQFKGSDIRFLTKAPLIWEPFTQLSGREFRECSLNMSYRITIPMANFVNDVMLGEKRLNACKPGENVQYKRFSDWQIQRIINGTILRLLKTGGSPGDFFILTASVKRSHVRKIENMLVEHGIPCFVAMNEAEQMDEKMVSGKVFFSSFHSVKGRERKHVFILGFNQSYFTYYASELPTDVCPNTLYVGCTRAMENLYLFETCGYEDMRPLEFLQKNHFEMMDAPYITFNGNPQLYFPEDTPSSYTDQYHDVSPTTLIRFVSETVMEEISPILERIFILDVASTPEMELDLPVITTTTRGLYEDVSDLNGITIPIMYYDHLFIKYNGQSTNLPGSNMLISHIKSALEETKPGNFTFLKNQTSNISEIFSTPGNSEYYPEHKEGKYLYLTNLYVATKEKLYYKLKQIESVDYTWLTPELVEQCIARLDETIGIECSTDTFPLIEYYLINHSMEEETERARKVLAPFFIGYVKQFRFSAIVDALTPTTLWEFKCTSTLTTEHQLQVVVYAWLLRIVFPDISRVVRLFNIRTGEIQRLDATFDELTTIMVALLKGKYDKPEEKTDELFLDECREYLKQ